MVCSRCIKVVKESLEQLGYELFALELGKAQIAQGKPVDVDRIRKVFQAEGFELIDDQTAMVINEVKTAIIELIHSVYEEKQTQNLSEYLESRIAKNYSSLSFLFSRSEGRTIEKYAIQQRIERVKELLVYGEKTISEIAWELGYSSAQYLSNQFKSETSHTLTELRNMIWQGSCPPR